MDSNNNDIKAFAVKRLLKLTIERIEQISKDVDNLKKTSDTLVSAGELAQANKRIDQIKEVVQKEIEHADAIDTRLSVFEDITDKALDNFKNKLDKKVVETIKENTRETVKIIKENVVDTTTKFAVESLQKQISEFETLLSEKTEWTKKEIDDLITERLSKIQIILQSNQSNPLPPGTQFIFNFTDSTGANVNHSLGRYPTVTVIDSGGTEYEVSVIHTDVDNTIVSWQTVATGKIIFN